MQKKLLLLGGSRYLLPIINKAHELGAYVITCDYLPDNFAHKFSDEYHNVSIIDKDAVLSLAQELKIDGIMSFACDPGVVTAAYVAEKMGLPFQCSFNSASILQDKGLFRKFLIENGFNCPKAKCYKKTENPFNDVDYFNWPVIVKPVDSAGSKGVTRVDSIDMLQCAIDFALANAHSDMYIIEDFIVFEGHHSSTDPFAIDGKIKFITYSDQLFDVKAENPYTPAYIIWPSSMDIRYQNYLTHEIQRLFDLLNIKTGIFNIETCVGKGGVPYIMEISPRGGGCKIAELQDLAYGTNLIENEVRSALGMPLNMSECNEIDGAWCEMVVHTQSNQQGYFECLDISNEVKEKYLRVVDMSVVKGSFVKPFTGANCSLGDIFLRFNSREQLDTCINAVDDWLKVIVE